MKVSVDILKKKKYRYFGIIFENSSVLKIEEKKERKQPLISIHVSSIENYKMQFLEFIFENLMKGKKRKEYLKRIHLIFYCLLKLANGNPFGYFVRILYEEIVRFFF